MFPTSPSSRLRPSLKSLSLSVIVVAVSSYVVLGLLGLAAYPSFVLALAIAVVTLLYREAGLRSRLPEPFGRGEVSTLTAGDMRRTGILIVIGGILLVVVPVASVSFLPPLYFFTLIFGIVIGFPVSEVVYFARVAMVERRLGGVLRTYTAESDAGGEEMLIRSVRLEEGPSD